MKKVSINLLTNVILLLAGIILILFHGVPNILVWGARVMGATFLLPAVAYLVMVAVRHADARKSADYMGVLPAVGGLCFGLVMILKPDKFDEILQLLLGMLLVVLGLFVVLSGLLSLMLPSLRENVSMIVLTSGICLLLFNFTSLQEFMAERRRRKVVTDNSSLENTENEL